MLVAAFSSEMWELYAIIVLLEGYLAFSVLDTSNSSLILYGLVLTETHY